MIFKYKFLITINILKYLTVFIFFTSFSFTNIRYIDEIFENIIKTENIVYANSPDLPFIFLLESNTYDINLDMDIYEPDEYEIISRPAIIFLHSGSFFTGNNELDDMVDLAESAARRGYVAITLNYRLGLNILSSYSGERAVYRGVQDLSAAIRFLRHNQSDFNINPEQVFVWGSSAGAIIGLHMAFSEDDERPQSTYGQWGDPDLGCIDCEGNNLQYSSRPNAVISCWGAIGDLEWIEQDHQVPLIFFHGTSDFIVPHDIGFPFTANITLPIIYGSSAISERLTELNIIHHYYLAENQGHEYYGTAGGTWIDGPNEYFYDIQDNVYEFLYNLIDIYILGDLNSDELVNISDVIIIINFILNTDMSTENLDLNSDGLINILDIIYIVNIILVNS